MRASVLVGASAVFAGCQPLFNDNYMEFTAAPEQLREIEAIDLSHLSEGEPETVENAVGGISEGRIDEVIENLRREAQAPARMELGLDDVRAAALAHNLDLQVELVNPSIAQTSIDQEEAKFESTFVGSFTRQRFDSPTALATEGSKTTFTRFNSGVRIPLRTGGTVSVDFPLNKTETNNPFSTLNPSYEADLTFSISQPLLRNAGMRTNTHSIRVARYDAQITDARTKLEAIRILANADRAYWNLYAAQRELDVRLQQYELSVQQLEEARRRVAAGDAAGIEITRAESGVASGLEAIIISNTALRRVRRDIKRIMNRPDLPLSSPTEFVVVTEPAPLGLEPDPERLTAYALDNRMEMLQLELELARDLSTIDFERNQALPLFALDYSYNVNGLGSSYNRALDQIPDRSFEDWSVGLTAEIPIGNEAAEARVHRAILQRLQRLSSRSARDLAIRQEVLDALDNLEQNWQRILAARLESVLNGRTYEAEVRQFEVGLRTSTDVNEAATNLADAQAREVRALADYEIAKIDIAFATGTLLGHDRVLWTPIDTDSED